MRPSYARRRTPNHLGPVATGQRNPRIAAEFPRSLSARLEHLRHDRVRRQLEYGLAHHPFPERHGMFRIDFDDAEIDGDCSSAMPSSRRGSQPRGWLRAGRRAAWRIASRAAEGSDQSTSRLRRARQNHRSCVLAERLVSWRATSTGPRGVSMITVADRLGTPPNTERSILRAPAVG
jgi:hypothetical protein